MAGRPELAELARLPDLAEHVLEEVALGVGVHLFEMQVVHLAHDLGEHRRLVDDEAGAGHEVGDAPGRHLGVERKDLLAHPDDQPFAVQRVGPRGPAQGAALHRPLARRAGVPRIAEGPFPVEHARVDLGPGTARGADPGRVRRLEHVEEEEEAELLGVLGRIGIAAAEEVVADAVDAAPKLGGERHGPRQCSIAGGRRSPAAPRARRPPPRPVVVVAAAEDRGVEGAEHEVERAAAPEDPRRAIVAAEPREGVRVQIVVPEAVDRHRVGPDAAPDEARPARLLGVEGLLAAPRLEAKPEEGGAGLVLRRPDDPPVLVEGHPIAARGVDVVVHVEGEGPARRREPGGRGSRVSNGAARDVPFVVAVEVRHPHEVEHREVGLADVRGLARAAPPHLAVENGASREPRHHQVDDLRAVEAGVEHVHADEDLRELLLLESPDDRARVGGRPRRPRRSPRSRRSGSSGGASGPRSGRRTSSRGSPRGASSPRTRWSCPGSGSV